MTFLALAVLVSLLYTEPRRPVRTRNHPSQARKPVAAHDNIIKALRS
jgi:hypothetical protein